MKQRLTEKDYIDAAKRLGCEVAAIKAVDEVESRGDGFNTNGEPKILFERHKFYKYTKGAFYNQKKKNSKGEIYIDKTNNDICNPTQGGYGKESEQHIKLERAVKLDREAALMSCSWGRFQVMGYHWKDLGYKSLQEFINKMYESEVGHLDAFLRYNEVFGLLPYIRTKNWLSYAKAYNGPKYYINKYDIKLAAAYLKFSRK